MFKKQGKAWDQGHNNNIIIHALVFFVHGVYTDNTVPIDLDVKMKAVLILAAIVIVNSIYDIMTYTDTKTIQDQCYYTRTKQLGNVDSVGNVA